MPPLAYCDNNFLVTVHDSSAEYKTHLRGFAQTGNVIFVLSPWHWQDMAADRDHTRANSLADFCDSLDPLWLFDRRTIQKREAAVSLYKFAHIQFEPPTMTGNIADIIFDLLGTRAYRSCRAFVKHLHGVGPDHPIEKTFKNAFEANRANTVSFLKGKLPLNTLKHFDKLYVRGLLPSSTPAGLQLDESTKRGFLNAYTPDDCPAIYLETKITHENWGFQRTLKRNTVLDQQHAMALPYVDIFITDDAQLSKMLKRIVEGVHFRTAQIQTKAEFDSAFPV
jgi:hypothetical protein